MGHLGYSAWFGPLAESDDPGAQVHAALTNLNFERQSVEPPLVPGMIECTYRWKASGQDVRVAIGGRNPWGKLSLYPLTKDARDQLGVDEIRGMLRQLSEGLNVVLGRTHGESLLGVVKRSEIESGPDWLDWFQFWGAGIVERWGLDWIEAGPFRLVEPAAQGACAITLYSHPEEPEQMSLQARAADYLSITLRRPAGPPL